MLDPAELERRKQEDLEFQQELERRRPQIQERAGWWQAGAFFFVWLLGGVAMLRAYRHGIIAWILAALWFGAALVFGGAQSVIEWNIRDEIQEDINRRKT